MDDMPDPETTQIVEPEPEALIGKMAGNCRLTSVLYHRKGHPIIYAAKHLALDRSVVVKVLTPAVRAIAKEVVSRFEREAKLAAALTHPNIVQTYNADQVQGYLFIEMEQVTGPTLKDYVLKRGPLPLDEAIRIGRQLAAALSYAHERGIIHRDVKPDNIIMENEKVPKLLDFGIAKALSQDLDLTQSGLPIGTPRYMAPEQYEEAPDADHRADIYALGEVLYFMLSGEAPFPGDSYTEIKKQHLEGDYVPLRSARSGLPSRVLTMVDRMMATDVSRRYQSVEEVLRVIDETEEDRPKRPASTGRRMLLGATAVSLVSLLLLAEMFLRGGNAPLELDVAVLSQQKDGSGRPQQVQIEPGGEVRSGDNLRVTVTPSRTAYVYILLYGSEGKIKQLFPDNELQARATNPLAPGQTLAVPSHDLWYQVDYAPGTETIFVLASHDPIDEVDALVARMQEAGRVGVESQRIAAVSAGDRGISGISAGVTGDEEERRRISSVAEVAVKACGTVRIVSFRHLPPEK